LNREDLFFAFPVPHKGEALSGSRVNIPLCGKPYKFLGQEPGPEKQREAETPPPMKSALRQNRLADFA